MADITPDDMRRKWMAAGEQLEDDELAYMIEHNVTPGFNDHSSRAVLDAYRAGCIQGFMTCREHDRG